jgi:hypothetical protein
LPAKVRYSGLGIQRTLCPLMWKLTHIDGAGRRATAIPELTKNEVRWSVVWSTVSERGIGGGGK